MLGPRNRQSSTGRAGNIAFAAVVLAGYVSTLTSAGRFPLAELLILMVAGIAYLSIGIYGFALAERIGTAWIYLAYFAIQIPLGALIVYLSRGAGLLVIMPLAGHATALSRKGVALVCLLLFISTMAPFYARNGWSALAAAGFPIASAIIFVVIFTQVAVREQDARTEVERLATELRAANTKLRDYALQAEELATVKERNRLAHEIHDSLGHYLTAINIQIEAARVLLAEDAARAGESLAKAQALTKEGLTEVRRSVAALRASPLEGRSLAAAIGPLVDELGAAGVDATLEVQGTPRPLPPRAEMALYRVAQEALTNIRRHAQASEAHLTLDYTAPQRVRLAVRDNGIGTSDTTGGFGLLGLRERVQLLGGQVRLRTAVGEGFSLEVEVPT